MIDKLPFAMPDDPLLKARLAAIKAQGGNPFFDEQVPQAVIALKQGVGRLIRDEADIGVVMLCDTRLVTKGYGRSFITSLPPMKRTREFDEVRTFLRGEARINAATVNPRDPPALRVLAIDTSTEACSAALTLRDGRNRCCGSRSPNAAMPT